MRSETVTVRDPSRLSDTELVAEVFRLAGCEREAVALLISHLSELDARRLYLPAGFSSLFTYCTEMLRLSEHEAYNRIEAARTARRFPAIIKMVGDGALNLTTVRLLAPHLTADNHEELLAAASRKSKREVEELLVRHFPRSGLPTSVRKLPSSIACSSPTAVPSTALTGVAEDRSVTMALSPASPMEKPAASLPSPRRDRVRPLDPDRYAIRFTANARTREKLRLAQDLLRHAVPNGDIAEIIDRALSALLEGLARRKFAATERPRPSRVGSAGTRHIPARIKRAVWLRDGGRCAFVGEKDRRCAERGFLEFHHVKPYAVGGAAAVDNIEVRCRAHNAYEAALYYGPGMRIGADVLVPERVRPLGQQSAFDPSP